MGNQKMPEPMRVLIVSKEYRDGAGYQENSIYQWWKNRNAVISVFSKRISLTRSGRQYSCCALTSRIKVIFDKYDYIFVTGQMYFWGALCLIIGNATGRKISILGDNYGYRRYRQPSSINDPIYDLRKCLGSSVAAKYSDLVVGVTSETYEIVKSHLLVRSWLDSKYYFMGLGYDENQYYYSEEERRNKRIELGLDNGAVLFGICTKVNSIEKIRNILLPLVDVVAQSRDYFLLVAGITEDEVREDISEVLGRAAEKVILLPVLDQNELRTIFNAVDCTVWPNVSAGIQQALGTGHVVVVPDGTNVSHLKNYMNVISYEKLTVEFLVKVVSSFRTSRSDRESRSYVFRSDYSYDKVMTNILTAAHCCKP